jgi:hypothetical protein
MVSRRTIARREFCDGLDHPVIRQAGFATNTQQHKAYRQALLECGLELTILEADLGFRFHLVAILRRTSICAIVTRPGARSRTGEISIQLELGNF